VLTLLHPLFLPLVFDVMAAPPPVETPASAFANARMFGAPGALGAFAINGWLIGLGRTRAALGVQIVMNGANIALDMVLVWGFHLGALGVGIGTASAEWIALLWGALICLRVVGPGWRIRLAALDRAALFARAAMIRLFAVNADLMIRTLALLTLFTWFTHAGARLGAVSLAGNHVLMQFVSLSAFVLDAFAFTAESRVGMAVGARSLPDFRRAIRLTAEMSVVTGAAFALLFLAVGYPFVRFIAADEGTRAAAHAMLPYAALIPLIGAPSWLLDGIFVGATQGRAMRNAAVVVTALYLATDWLLRPLGNHGVWIALLASYVYRAATLLLSFPGLQRRTGLIAA
jgi:MATE family multidrug resistance protein